MKLISEIEGSFPTVSWNQLWFYPERVDECPDHKGYTRLFTFESAVAPHAYFNSDAHNWWCVRCFESKEEFSEVVVPIIKKFFEDNPEIALEV